MKINYRKIFIASTIIFTISLFVYSFAFFPTGYVGTTRKNQGNLGCICHHDTASAIVNVEIIGPDSIPAGTTALYRVKLTGGPAVTGGFNVANYRDSSPDTLSLTAVPGDTSIRKELSELTHTHPKFFSNDTVSWYFQYTASNILGFDTLYATGNSTNNDNQTDTVDRWNWSLNKPVKIFTPIGIINISSIAEKFSLSQNYPNPFNPVTQINFTIAKTSDVKIKVYDVTGNEVAVPVNSRLAEGEYRIDFNGTNLSSGAYFYSLIIDGRNISTKKMLLVK
ncbi:MAG: T9SS type A sorting domain-containing protein [Ignavibacteria bacterium]|nr:T9SS type A sorting domain-containing protein [Ignavibacteria bacterium]